MLKHNPQFLEQDGDDTWDEHDTPVSPVVYEDHNHTHHLSMSQLAARAGANFRDLGSDDKKFTALLNPELALPAAYQYALKIYEIEQKQESTGKTLVLAADARALRDLNKRLQTLLDDFMIRTPTTNGQIDEGALMLQDGEESLGNAVQTKITEVLSRFETDHPIEESEPAVVLEALGQLCEQELARQQSTPALHSETPSARVQPTRQLAHERTAPQLEDQTGRARGGSKKKPE